MMESNQNLTTFPPRLFLQILRKDQEAKPNNNCKRQNQFQNDSTIINSIETRQLK